MDDHDQVRLSEMVHLTVPDPRDKSPSPADSLASSVTDLSVAPITGKSRRHRDRQGVTRNLAFAIVAGAVGSSFQHGYNTGVVNAPQALVEEFINLTYSRRFEEPATKSTVTFIFSILVSVFCVGGMLGAVSTAYVAERCGRRGGLLLNNVLVFLAAALMGFAQMARSYEMIILGRFIIGVNSGLNAGLAPMYLAEISPISLRGAVGTIYQLVITISILISQVLGLPGLLGTQDRWPYMFGLIVFPALFMLATLPLCPESPKFILINQEKEVAAQKALTWLRGTIEVHDEMDEMRAEYETMKLVPKVTLYEMWHNPMLFQPLFIAVMMMLSQQLSGINAAIYFSTEIFQNSGLNAETALYATLAMGSINVLMTFVSLVLVERTGRRTLHLVGLAGMMVLTILLAFCLAMKDQWPWISYLSIICVIGFVVMFATGPGSIPWFLVTELFGQGARPLATSIAVTVNWCANFVVGLAFLPLRDLLEGYTFLVFSAFLALFWFFTYRRVPETKNKSADEIAAIFREKIYQ